MSQHKTLLAKVSRVLGRTVLGSGLLLCAGGPSDSAQADDQTKPVLFSDGFGDDGGYCPSESCPPGGMTAPTYPSPQYQPTAPYSAPGVQSSPYPPSFSPSSPSSSPSSSLPQASPSSPIPEPFTGTQSAQADTAPPGFSPEALAAASAPPSVAPNMLGDFFGGMSSKPVILPGTVVSQAILFSPGGDSLDYYRAVNSLGGNNYQTDDFVYLGSTAGGQPVSVMPDAVPSQLLQEYDGSLFTGDPIDLGLVTNSGPFLALDSGETGEVDVVAPETPTTLMGEPIFNIHEALLVIVPTPGTGGGVGRQKIAENTSPIPRDRVFINHSTFTGVPLTTDGMTVVRFSPGVEWAFYQQRMSVEIRMPFASTLDSDINASGGTDRESTQFGNIVTTFKALVHQTPSSAVAVGVSLTAPTAKDVNVDVSGTPFISIENESVHVMPYIGGVTARGRWFSQWYVQGDIDTTGSPVDIRNVNTGQIEDAGVLHDAPFLYASLSYGYWLYQSGNRAVSFDNCSSRQTVKRTVYTGGGGITGLAPLVEFHFNRSLDKGETITSGPIQLQSASDFALSNLVVGAMMTFGTGGSLSLGWGTPIIGQDDAQFDHEFRALLGYDF